MYRSISKHKHRQRESDNVKKVQSLRRFLGQHYFVAVDWLPSVMRVDKFVNTSQRVADIRLVVSHAQGYIDTDLKLRVSTSRGE